MALEGDKKILVIAFLTSLTVSLVINLLYVYGGQLCGGKDSCPVVIQEEREIIRGPSAPPSSGPSAIPPGKPGSAPGKSIAAPHPVPGMQNRRRGEVGGFGMRLVPATPELLALYKERAEMYQKIADLILQQVKAAAVDQKEAITAVALRDEAKLAYWRRENNMRPAKGAAEAFIHVKETGALLQLAEGLYKSNTIPPEDLNKAKAKFLDAEIQLGEALLSVRDKAAWDKASKALEKYPDNVTDELLRALLAAEQPQRPR